MGRVAPICKRGYWASRFSALKPFGQGQSGLVIGIGIFCFLRFFPSFFTLSSSILVSSRFTLAVRVFKCLSVRLSVSLFIRLSPLALFLYPCVCHAVFPSLCRAVILSNLLYLFLSSCLFFAFLGSGPEGDEVL